MSSTDTELCLLLVKYIDKYEGIEELREVLKKTSASSRYEALRSCKGANDWTSAMRSAEQGDIDTLKCMLVGLDSHQIYQVMKFKSDEDSVPLLAAACNGDTDIIMYILCNLSPEDRFNALKLTNNKGQTVAHWAAHENKPKALQLLLTSVTQEQQRELLAIKTNKGNTVRDLITLPDLSYDYFTANELGNGRLRIKNLESQVETQAAELVTADKRVDELESLLQEQKTTISQQATEGRKTKESVKKLEIKLEVQGLELSTANQRVDELESVLQAQRKIITQQATALQRLTERQKEMQRVTERALREMDKFNKRCFSTADTGDQEHEF